MFSHSFLYKKSLQVEQTVHPQNSESLQRVIAARRGNILNVCHYYQYSPTKGVGGECFTLAKIPNIMIISAVYVGYLCRLFESAVQRNFMLDFMQIFKTMIYSAKTNSQSLKDAFEADKLWVEQFRSSKLVHRTDFLAKLNQSTKII